MIRFYQEYVLNKVFYLTALLFICYSCGMTTVNAQVLPNNLQIALEAALTQSEALRDRIQPDSAYLVLLAMERTLDSLEFGDTPSYRRLELEQSINNAKRERFLLAMKTTNAVAEASCERGEWSTCAAAQLQLSDLNLRLRNRAESRAYLKKASELILRERLQALAPREKYQLANWQANFGYRDSVIHFLDSFFLIPDASPALQASAYRMYARLSIDLPEIQDSMFRKAATLYASIGAYRNTAATLNSLAVALQQSNVRNNILPLLKDAERYCQEGQRRKQNVALTMAAINQTRGIYYRVKGQPDSALFFIERSLRREIRYWRSSTRIKESEAREMYRNEQQEKQLARREKELQIERLRSYGLIGFAGMIVLLSLWSFRLYRKLQVSNRTIKTQASGLEISNLELTTAKGKLEDSLQLQKMLKAELQHRVKNNMQLILAIFNEGRDNVEDPGVQRMLKAQQDQIRSIVLLQQQINLKSSEREIDPAAYLHEIVTNLERSYSGVHPGVKIHLDLNIDLIHIDTAIPLGLIINELVTNAYKYAFPEKRVGNIRITFSKLPNHFYLRVADDGIGLPNNVKTRRNGSMGTRLLRGLTRQLEGTIEWITTKPGTVVQIKFGVYSAAIV